MTAKTASTADATANVPAPPPPFLMRMGCTNTLFTFRATGNEGLCLQSAQHGVQQIANFNPAAGDILALDDLLEQTMAHANLSDIGLYLTSQVVDGGTMLSVDLTGHGGAGSPVAFLQGVDTSVSQLVAAGAINYIPDAITVTPTFNTTVDLRPSGLTTVLLNRVAPGIGPQQISNFNPATGDKLELANILNSTVALPNLSDIANYITVTNSGGNTILSVDASGNGGAGTAFAELNGVTLTISQLLADNALLFDPTHTTVTATPGTPFTFRSEGSEMVMVPTEHAATGAQQLVGFSLAGGDGINVANVLLTAGVAPDLSTIQNYFSTVTVGADTQLWFDPTGSHGQTTLEALFKNTSVTMAQLLEHSALGVTHGPGVVVGPSFIMRMGCTNATITYRGAGNEGVCLQDASHGVQQLVNFNPAVGDFISVDDVLELTQAHDDLSDVSQYITSQQTGGGTMLYFDATGEGKTGTPFAFLQGVTTTVADLVENGGMRYIPDAITVTPQLNGVVSVRPDGLETVNLTMAPGLGPNQVNFFDPTKNEKLELANILGHTLAQANLSDVANYITVSNSGGNTTLSLDPTGHGQGGTPFVILNGVTVTLSQLLANHALTYDPTFVESSVVANTPFTYRSAGIETANLMSAHGTAGVQQLAGFSLNAGDGIDVTRILGNADVQTDMTHIQNYFSTVQVGANTQLWFDPSGSGHGGTLEAVFQNTTVTMPELLAHSAVHFMT